MKIGIFGGSFNPPHRMHQTIALELIKNGYVDKVIYVPTGNLYPKENLALDKDRYTMLKELTEGNTKLEVSDYEFQKRTFTYQTLDHFQKKYPKDEIYFICGTDNLQALDTWKKYQYILDHFKLLVIPRNQDNTKQLLNKYASNKASIIIANITYDTISSTEIRELLKKDRTSQKLKKNLLPKTLNFIIQKNLYY